MNLTEKALAETALTESAEAVAPWPESLLGTLARYGRPMRFAKKAILISEGDEAGALYVVLSGRVKVYIADENGKELVLDECGAGSLFGEVGLDGGVRSASVMALETTHCAVLTHEVLLERLAAEPSLALEIIRVLTRRVRHATRIAKQLALSNVYSRVVSLLTSLAEPTDTGDLVIPISLSQQDIARRVGASRDMVNRVFKELQKGEYIAVDQRRITLLRKLPLDW